jgi:hypothetical protein
MSAHAVEALDFKVSPALDHAISRIAELARECGDKGREIIKLRQQIEHYKNGSIRPYRGCKLHETRHGEASVVLEYEFEPAEREDEFYIGSAATASVIRVWIGGEPFSYELFNESTIQAWEAECVAAEVGV